MTDLQTSSVSHVRPFGHGPADSAGWSTPRTSGLIPAHEVEGLIATVNEQLEALQTRVVEAVAAADLGEEQAGRAAVPATDTGEAGLLRDALVQIELLGSVQADRAVEAADAHAAALVAEARATADELVLQAQVDRVARLVSLEVPPRGPMLRIETVPPGPTVAPDRPTVDITSRGASGLPASGDEEQEARRFVEFWGAPRTDDRTETDHRHEELAAIALGLIGALVLLVVALAWLG